MKTTIHNKKGFTLIESVCVVAIIVMLSSVLIMAIGDHIRNAKKAAAILENNNDTLHAIDQQVYGTVHYNRSTGDAELYGTTGTPGGGSSAGGASTGGGAAGGSPAAGADSTGGSGGSGGSGGGGAAVVPSEIKDNDITDVAPESGGEYVSGEEDFAEENAAVPEDEDGEEEEDPEEAQIAAVAGSINAFATAHDVSYLPGTEELPNIIATAEVTAVNLYQEGDYTGPRYFTYCPATGETRLANGNGTYMQQDIGQNLLKAYLRDAAAEACEGSNVRGRLDSSFLSDSSRVIYIGVNQSADGSYQVVPNLCIDTLGNFNTVITFRYSNSTTDRVTWNSNGGWNSYVNYVTNQSGDMLDTSVLDTSAYTRSSSAAHDNPIWQAAINDLRSSYS